MLFLPTKTQARPLAIWIWQWISEIVAGAIRAAWKTVGVDDSFGSMASICNNLFFRKKSDLAACWSLRAKSTG